MIYLIDLFCGGGGTSTGANSAENVKVIYCVNHDPLAIKSHAANHPDCIHKTEDILLLDLTELENLIQEIRINDPFAIIGLWASLECTNFSKAKGGQPRDADSRTLAHGLYRYIEQLDIDLIYIENVIEFMSWGPLDDKGKPLSKFKGVDYINWVETMKAFGYDFDCAELISADYGACQKRKRYFAQFAKPEFHIVWPEKTHNADGSGGLQKYNPVRDVLDLDEYGPSVFIPGRIRSSRTFARIYAGLEKYVAKGDTAFLQAYYGTGDNVSSIDNACPTVTPGDRFAVVQPVFLIHYYGRDNAHSSIDDPATVPTNNRLAKVDVQFLDQQYGKSMPTDINKPIGTIPANPKHNLVTTQFLYNPQYQSKGGSIDEPCFTIIARMDKTPPYLITTVSGATAIPVFADDCVERIKVKRFMAAYGIGDIKMRMLKITELLQIMGFPKDYILHGTQKDKKKFIGNAVEVNQARANLSASAKKNVKHKLQSA